MIKTKTPPFPKLQHYLTRSMKIFTVCLVMVMLMIPENILQACGGTPAPPCGRAIWLAKFTPGVVVIPPAGGP
ncbi:MAG: hypothetical protein ACI81W_003167, partial [Saprospiraceae bacterium]